MTNLENILDQGSSWLNNWLSTIEISPEHELDKSLLRGIAEGSAFRARAELSIEWANVAVRSYEFLARTGTISEKNSALSSAMNLRAFLISKLGSSPEHPVLDPEIIIKWFNRESKYSFAQTKEILQKGIPLKDQLVDEVLELRRIKNRLSVLKILADNDKLPARTDFENWFRLRDQLP